MLSCFRSAISKLGKQGRLISFLKSDMVGTGSRNLIGDYLTSGRVDASPAYVQVLHRQCRSRGTKKYLILPLHLSKEYGQGLLYGVAGTDWPMMIQGFERVLY